MIRTALLALCLATILDANLIVFAQEKGINDFPELSAKTDWPWWRGPTRNGVAAVAKTPTKLSGASGYLWKAPVPGRGHSSPIVVGSKVFLTTADTAQQVHSVLAFDRKMGETLWQTEINRGAFPARNHAKNTEASPTLACDGERLFATFYHHDQVQATALDLDGKILWQKSAGHFHPQKYEYGYAPSPVIYRGTVIVTAEYDGRSFMVALDRKTGGEVWRVDRPNNITFSTPVIAHLAGKDQLLMSGGDQVTSMDPASGKPFWSVPGTTAATCGTLVWDGDIVFASGGYPKAETLAVKADGSKKVLWTNNQKCYEQSMITHDGHLYALTDQGVAFCWRAGDGREMWKKRLTGPVSASPVLVGNDIYWANELGTLYVFKASPQKFDLVAENHVGDESFASPAICGGQVFLRVAENMGGKRQELLYCFGGK